MPVKHLRSTIKSSIGIIKAQTKTQTSKSLILGKQKRIFLKFPKLKLRGRFKKKIKAPFTFAFQPDAIKLGQARTFRLLLEDIRHHLLHSPATRLIYINMAWKFFDALPNDLQVLNSLPTDEDFFQYIFSNWPKFVSFTCQESKLTWGKVMKGEGCENEIHILSDIVLWAETAAGGNVDNRLSADLYKIIIVVIIFHEISHAFTKFWFHEICTPIGVGVGEDPNYGESGWMVEMEIMGGRIVAEWDDVKNFGKMNVIDRVLLLNNAGTWKISPHVAKGMLLSLRERLFERPANFTLKEYVPREGSAPTARGRVTQSTVNPIPVETRPGLGITFPGPFRSYIGYDRRVPEKIE